MKNDLVHQIQPTSLLGCSTNKLSISKSHYKIYMCAMIDTNTTAFSSICLAHLGVICATHVTPSFGIWSNQKSFRLPAIGSFRDGTKIREERKRVLDESQAQTIAMRRWISNCFHHFHRPVGASTAGSGVLTSGFGLTSSCCLCRPTWEAC